MFVTHYKIRYYSNHNTDSLSRHIIKEGTLTEVPLFLLLWLEFNSIIIAARRNDQK